MAIFSTSFIIFIPEMQKKVKEYIDKHHLFAPTDKVLITVSGGADSVALLHILLKLGYTCEAIHCNFHLRGEESNRDEQFVTNLCRELQVPIKVVHFDTVQYAKQHHLSIEMAAREQRYHAFEEHRKAIGASVIAVAHHRDDAAETFLLNLIRGTGINGLQGIKPINGKIVRPLLCTSRKEILEYINSIHQDYITDSTNLEEQYARNKIRRQVLPMMANINPAVNENILKTAEHLSEALVVYNQAIEADKKEVINDDGNVVIEKLLSKASPHALLFEILYPLGFNSAQIDAIFQSLNAQSGKQFLSAGYTVVKDRAQLLIQKTIIVADVHTELPTEGTLAVESINLHIQQKENLPHYAIPKEKHFAALDSDKLQFPLFIRRWREGDRFIPFGMKGFKNVSDYLTDKKFSLLQKQQQLVICSGNNIVWLVGERIDNRYRVTEETKHITEIALE